jgi:hypothetical protein
VPVETVLHGPLPDQAALAAFLTRLEDFGADVIEIRRLSQDTGLLLLPVQPVTQAPARQEQWTSDRSEDRCHV